MQHSTSWFLSLLGAMASDSSMNLHSSLLLQKLYFQTPAILFMIDGKEDHRCRILGVLQATPITTPT